VFYECFQVTVKLPLLMEPGCAFTVFPDCIVIGSRPESVFIATPFTVEAEKPTLPKFASGRTPLRLDGASAMTSAEASAALCSFAFVVFVHPCVLSVIVSVKLPEPFVVTEAERWSPGLTVPLRLVGYFGYISYQA